MTIDLASGGMSEIGLDTFATSPVESIHDGEYYLRVDGVLSTQIGGRLTTSVLDKNGNGIKQLANDTSGPWYFVDAVRFGIASDNTLIVNSEKVNRKFSIGDFELLEEHSAPPARFGSPFNQTGEKFVTPSGNNVLEIESFGENSTEVLSNFYDIKAAQGVDPQTIMISEPSLIKWFDLDEGIIRSRLPIESPSRFVYVKNLNLLIAFRYIINQTGLVYDVNTGEQVGTQDWPELPWSNLHLIDDEHVIVAAAEKIVFAHTIESNQTIWQASTPKNLYLRSFMTDVNPRDTNYACIYAVLNTEPTQYKMLEYTIYSDEVPVVCNLDFVPALLKYIDDETILILSSEGDVYLVENGEISLYINTGVKIEDRTVKVISPDGKWLVLDDEIWDLQNKTQIPDLSHEVGSFEIAGFTADGEKIFFVHADDTISVWDVDRLTGMTSTVKNSIEYK
ncbi:MAG: hypothetical protein GC154_09295 [bacterium]|nr:hypothetical protein [bacterium]